MPQPPQSKTAEEEELRTKLLPGERLAWMLQLTQRSTSERFSNCFPKSFWKAAFNSHGCKNSIMVLQVKARLPKKKKKKNVTGPCQDDIHGRV